ncbi:MAG: hypothetical protein M9925_03915 [Chloroflexi bacterium]|jgi:hypothetical protein|nr:hypothetical protein [Dehalococcoidia bacterium]MCO5200828.1 hypothetical protein [Chloroflexota bacterium]MCZ7578680.1 hypothetical protein [Dehalococcoidia bacterium]PWB44919.1 MAG: hypothetical protein C3F10_06825 [Dehalococcoidia bacterium]
MHCSFWVTNSVLLAMAIAAVACGGDERDDWTGDAAVDATIRLVLDGDRDAFRDSLEAVERQCKPAGTTDVGELPCPEGTTGATARVFQVTGCHAEYRAAEQFGEVAEAFFGAGSAGNDWKLYAVYRGIDDIFGETYRVVFVDGNGDGRAAWVRSPGKVVLVELGCGATAPAAFVEGVTGFVVAPGD